MDASEQIKRDIEKAEMMALTAAQFSAEAQELLGSLKQLYEILQVPIAAIFGQRDPAWARDFMGTGGGTIDQYGCLMCCLASTLKDAGYDTDPRRLNAFLNLNGGYKPGSANLASFSLISKVFPAIHMAEPVIFTPNMVPFDKINATIQGGGYSTVMVDFYGKPHVKDSDVAMHWVRLLGENLIMDPWEGRIMPLSPRYGKEPGSAIWRIALYAKRGTHERSH